MPLVIAYSKIIAEPLGKEYLEMKEKRKFFTSTYYSRHKRQVRRYCIADCALTAELAERWIDTFYMMFGFYPQNWISAGYLAEKVLIYNKIPMPFFHDFDYSLQELARAAFYGGDYKRITTCLHGLEGIWQRFRM